MYDALLVVCNTFDTRFSFLFFSFQTDENAIFDFFLNTDENKIFGDKAEYCAFFSKWKFTWSEYLNTVPPFRTHCLNLHQAFLIAFTSEFLPRLLYKYEYDWSLSGYVNFTLATAPNDTLNEECRCGKQLQGKRCSRTSCFRIVCLETEFYDIEVYFQWLA